MNRVYERDLGNEPGTRALIVGVGAYPHLAVGGAPAPDLASAPAGAILFANWLIAHADQLRPRLASIDLLMSMPAGAPANYQWVATFPQAVQAGALDPRGGSTLVEPAVGTQVEQAGQEWRRDLTARGDNTAILYVCGHGVATPNRNLVLLSDVNKDHYRPWEPHLDVQINAARMRRDPALGQAYVFVDACQELISEVLLAEADRAQGLSTIALFPPSKPVERNKVYVLVPGPMGSLAFDDGKNGGGRFTHILIEALSGAAACNFAGTGAWGIIVDSLHTKMKLLYSLREQWRDKELEPTPVYPITVQTGPLLEFPASPKIPICIRLEPVHAMQNAHSLRLVNGVAGDVVAVNLPPAPPPRPELCIVWPNAAAGSHYIRCDFPPGHPGANKATQIDISEMRVRPILVHDVG